VVDLSVDNLKSALSQIDAGSTEGAKMAGWCQLCAALHQYLDDVLEPE
jgi:hypothetical protein